MNLRRVDLNLLIVFDAIHTERNLTRAAKKIGMSQPAMSNALSRLRHTLGDPLFKRTSQGMIPTPRAKELAEPIHQALDLIQNGLIDRRQFDYTSSTRQFVIAVEDYGEAVIMPRLVEWLTQVAPGIRIQVRPEPGTKLQSELQDGRVDMALDFFKIRRQEFKTHHVMDETLVSMARLDHPVVNDHLTLDNYTELPHVALLPRTRAVPAVDRALMELGLSRNVAVQVPHFLSMPLLIQQSNLLCTLPRRMARVYADVFRLRMLKTPVELPTVPIYLIWHRSMDENPGHQWLRTAIIDLCQRL